MISTKHLTSDITEVPREWIFEHYLNLSEKLTGQDVRIKSMFTPNDKNPSMFVFFAHSQGKYMFKDFSTGKGGDCLTLVQLMFSLKSRGEASFKVISDYNQYRLTNPNDMPLREFKVHSKYRITNFMTRGWTNVDEKYWSKYHIGSKLLEAYNVVPLESYTLTKDEQDLVIKSLNIYGYFKKDGTLCKIYQPLVKKNKFLKIKDYIQGSEQLTMKKPYLIICSSLKDVMTFVKLGYNNAEAVAPDSENTLIPDHIMTSYKFKYKNVCTLFDDDEAGIEAMNKYSERYDIPFVHLQMGAKDLSDCVKEFGLLKVKSVLTPLLKEVLTEKEKPIETTNNIDQAPF